MSRKENSVRLLPLLVWANYFCLSEYDRKTRTPDTSDPTVCRAYTPGVLVTIQVGTQLGPYEITAPIGKGGMGEIYRARDMRLDRSVAIKFLPAAFADDARLKTRFDREAKTIASLNHPNICTLYDFGNERGMAYLVMEYLEGESLGDKLTKGALPFEQVLRYGVEIASALDQAHRHGIVHRDLKPGNIVITKSGAKLLDFGLAKNVVLDVSPEGATQHKPFTAEGTILGTVQYMAPEQLEGLEADARSDIFAFGVVLYEMATGRRAFPGKSNASIIAAILSSHPQSVSEIRPSMPPAFDHVITKCLEKNPAERWQSVHDVAEELRWIGESRSEVLSSTSRGWKAGALMLGAAAIAGAGLALISTWALQRQAPQNFSFTIPSMGFGQDRAHTYHWAGDSSISPDGRRVIFAAESYEWIPQLWIRELDAFDVEPVPGTQKTSSGRVYFIAWSPDSNYFAAHREGQIVKIPVSGGSAKVLADAPLVGSSYPHGYGSLRGDWNDDGDILLALSEAPIACLRSGAQNLETITRLDKSHFEIAHTKPSFLPDGRRFLFIALTRDPRRRDQPHRLYAGSLDSDEVRFIGEIESRVQYVRPGYLLAVRDATLVAYPFDLKKLRITGDPITVADNVVQMRPIGDASFSVSRNGVLITQGLLPLTRVYWLAADGSRSSSVGPPGLFETTRISPDGTQLAVSMRDKTETSDLWIYGLDRDTSRRLTHDSTWEGSVAWSRDGSRLYYGADRTGFPDIFVQNADGTSREELVLARPEAQYPQDISPDGKFLLYQTFEDPRDHGDLYVMPLEGERTPRPFVKTTFIDGATARFSPDGRWVAYTSNQSGQVEVYVTSFPGPGPSRQISSGGNYGPRWSADGTKIYFIRAGEVYVADFSTRDGQTGTPRRLFEFSSDGVGWDVAPDGRILAVASYSDNTSAPFRVVPNWTRLLKR